MIYLPAFRSHPLLALLAALLIASLLGRGVLATQQGQHTTAPMIDPQVKAQQHGHYHPTELGHFHDESLELSDSSHTLLHSISALENQLNHPSLTARLTKSRVPLQRYLLPDPTDPQLPGLYRPPRV